MRRSVGVLALVCLLAACTGDAGPTGPAGPAGAQGAQGLQGSAGAQGQAGAGTRLVYIRTVDATGVAAVTLPAAVGTDFNQPPLAGCYLLNGTAAWVPI